MFGGVIKACDILMEPTKLHMEKNLLPIFQNKVKLVFSELKEADAAFFCGTAAEVVGWESLDEVTFPKPWNETVSRRVQEVYMDKVKEKEYKPSLELA